MSESGNRSPGGTPPDRGAAQLDVLKTLGDNTRYAIYLELARSAVPLSTAEVAATLNLHPNTVRPHLERMRDVSLVEVDTVARGGVGRPHHRYALSAEAPGLGLEPSPWPTLARILVSAASSGGLDATDLHTAGVEQGRHDAHLRWQGHGDAVAALTNEQARLGFDPEVVTDDETTTMAFANCPFRELAEEHPELVCSLHCGMVEGLVDELGGHEVTRFRSLADRNPCQVELAPT